MVIKDRQFNMKATQEELAAIRELAALWHTNGSAAILRAVYEARQRARQEAALDAAWRKAQEVQG